MPAELQRKRRPCKKSVFVTDHADSDVPSGTPGQRQASGQSAVDQHRSHHRWQHAAPSGPPLCPPARSARCHWTAACQTAPLKRTTWIMGGGGYFEVGSTGAIRHNAQRLSHTAIDEDTRTPAHPHYASTTNCTAYGMDGNTTGTACVVQGDRPQHPDTPLTTTDGVAAGEHLPWTQRPQDLGAEVVFRNPLLRFTQLQRSNELAATTQTHTTPVTETHTQTHAPTSPAFAPSPPPPHLSVHSVKHGAKVVHSTGREVRDELGNRLLADEVTVGVDDTVRLCCRPPRPR